MMKIIKVLKEEISRSCSRSPRTSVIKKKFRAGKTHVIKEDSYGFENEYYKSVTANASGGFRGGK